MSIDYKELEKRVSDIETRAKDILEKRKALKLANEIRSNRENVYYNTKLNTKVNTIMEERNISKELLERRAVTLSGTGTTVTDSELVKLVKNTHKVLGDVKFYYGANGTVIPVQASLPSVPSSKAESDFTNAISNANTLALTTISLTPSEDVAGLALTDYNLRMSAISESELISIFAEAFGDKWDSAIQDELVDASNVDSANKVTAAAAGYATWADIIPLAIKLRGKNGTFKFYMTAEQEEALEQKRETDYDFYAEELIRKGTIKGIEVVILDKNGSTTAGNVLVFATDLKKNYAFGLAQDVVVEEVPSMYAGKQYKGSAFIDHKFICNKNNYCIVAHS